VSEAREAVREARRGCRRERRRREEVEGRLEVVDREVRRMRLEEGEALRRVERGVRRVREMARRVEKMGDVGGGAVMTVEEAEARLARVERERAQMGRVVIEVPPADRGSLEAQQESLTRTLAELE
jgi:chromosome segregation ATPase